MKKVVDLSQAIESLVSQPYIWNGDNLCFSWEVANNKFRASFMGLSTLEDARFDNDIEAIDAASREWAKMIIHLYGEGIVLNAMQIMSKEKDYKSLTIQDFEAALNSYV